MEFLRFGGRIPGAGIGCCAIDVVQGFGSDPDAKASIQTVHGDSGTSLGCFLGMTNKEVFLARLRIGTFSREERPCRAFLCSITQNQLKTTSGLKWLKILRENGFEFIRSVHNSVYGNYQPNHVNYIFGLFRNVGAAAVKDPFAPPEGWNELPEPKSQQEIWDAGKETLKFYTEEEVRKAGVLPMLAGRSGAAPKYKAPEPVKTKANPFIVAETPEEFAAEVEAEAAAN